MITGNSHPKIAVKSYETPEEAAAAALAFLQTQSVGSMEGPKAAL
jgi:hypothetical protein